MCQCFVACVQLRVVLRFLGKTVLLTCQSTDDLFWQTYGGCTTNFINPLSFSFEIEFVQVVAAVLF